MPKQVYIYGDSLLKATQPERGITIISITTRYCSAIRSAGRRW